MSSTLSIPPRTVAKLATKPLHGTFVTQVDTQINEILSSDSMLAAVKLLWQTSPVIIFRKQVLTESDQVALSSRFGQCIEIHRKDNVSPYESKVVYFSTLRYADGRMVGAFSNGDEAGWHADQTYTPNPATGALLYGVEVPRDGGVMSWADQYAAYDLLPREIQEAIEGKVGTFRYTKYADNSEVKGKEKELATLPDGNHEIVIQHPITGRKCLYVDPTRLVSVHGWSDAENERILPILFKVASDPSVVYHHRVISGDAMLWDNASTLHQRDAISLDQPRLMKRTTFRLPREAHGLPSGCFEHASA
ncbi:TauD/TfdA family dioxygenase [soil metagenome]